MAERERRLAAARVWSRIEVGLATVAVAVPPLIYVAAPTTFEPMFRYVPFWGTLLMGLAYPAMLLGYAWLLRIRFTGPEDGARSNWRSH